MGTLIKSTDGGNSWTIRETNTTTPMLKVRSYNGQIVIASGFGGLILRSTDGGETFMQVVSNVTGDLWGLRMINDTLGWACGNANSLTKTTDGGQTWQRMFTPGYTSDYWWIDFMNESYGFIAANGKVLRTIDGGQNWEIIQAGDAYSLFTIDVIDSLHIAAAGYGGSGYPAKNIYSSDGGNTWINRGMLTTSEINCIKYISLDTGYVVMSNIGIWKTTNRGQNWIITGGIGEYELQYFLQERIAYNTGTGLKLWKADGNYDVWHRIGLNIFATRDICFIDSLIGFTIKILELYKTTNSGNTWFNHLNSQYVLRNFGWLSKSHGFIIGDGVYEAIDSGKTWNEILELRNIGLRKFHSPENYIGFSVGNLGLIKKFDERVTNIEDYDWEMISRNFNLYQNYPNPFNPTTSIKYDIPNKSEVTLAIYDVLGRKIKELVNTEQQAGRYEVQFDASNLASGVYIYQLVAEKYMQSRKMILLK